MSFFLSPLIRQRFFDNVTGAPLAGGQLFSYAAGTTTPQSTYSNSTGTLNANPVVLDSNGYADVWTDPSISYKFVLQDSGGSTLWTVDNVNFPVVVTSWSSTTTYSQGDIVQDASGVGLFYVSMVNNNLNNTLATSVSKWRRLGGNIRTVSTNTTILATDELVRSNSTAGSLTHTLPACSTTSIGTRIRIKDVGTGGNTTSVKGNGTDNIDGANTYANVLVLNDSVEFENNGASWDVVLGLISIHAGGITTAMIAANAVTTAKIANNAVGQAQRAALGQQVSSSCGTFSTASTSFVSVTNLSVSITTTGRPVMLSLQSDGAVSVNASCSTSGSNNYVVGFAKGGTLIARYQVQNSNASGGALVVPANQTFIDTPAAGTYTYTVQIVTGGGTVSLNNAVLVAYEL